VAKLLHDNHNSNNTNFGNNWHSNPTNFTTTKIRTKDHQKRALSTTNKAKKEQTPPPQKIIRQEAYLKEKNKKINKIKKL
jgi:hypothetical protein